MCIVIDVNTLPAVFKTDCADHSEFKFVKDYIDGGLGVIVFGGKSYLTELAKMKGYLKLLEELRKKNCVVRIDDTLIDEREAEVIQKTSGTDCDDQHIIAILGVSRCPLLCSLDKRSYPFVKDRQYYKKHEPRVAIYSSSKNADKLVKMPPDRLLHVV